MRALGLEGFRVYRCRSLGFVGFEGFRALGVWGFRVWRFRGLEEGFRALGFEGEGFGAVGFEGEGCGALGFEGFRRVSRFRA